MRVSVTVIMETTAYATVEVEAEELSDEAIEAALSEELLSAADWRLSDGNVIRPRDVSIMEDSVEEIAPSQIAGHAVFQGEAWIMDHAVAVDDARFTYPVTVAEYRDAQEFDDALDDLKEAAAAPREVKDWNGPFSIRFEPLPTEAGAAE